VPLPGRFDIGERYSFGIDPEFATRGQRQIYGKASKMALGNFCWKSRATPSQFGTTQTRSSAALTGSRYGLV